MLRMAPLLLCVLGLYACSCPHIAETEAAARQAWDDLLASYLSEAEAARAVAERLRVVVPADHLTVTTIEQAVRGIEQDHQQVNPHDSRAVQTLDRWHRVLEAKRAMLERIVRDRPEEASDAALTLAVRRWNEFLDASAAARDRYQKAALAYNRALRTFPESVINNMFLKKEAWVLLQTDRNANARAETR